MDNYETGIYTDNPDDTLRYMRSTQAVAMTRCRDCKFWIDERCEQIRLDDWIRQAERDAAGTGNIPVIVFRKSGEPWRAVVPAIEFFKMYKGGENESVRN